MHFTDQTGLLALKSQVIGADVGFEITVNQLTIANSMPWYSHVMRREDGTVLRRVLEFEVEGQSQQG